MKNKNELNKIEQRSEWKTLEKQSKEINSIQNKTKKNK